MSIMSSYAVEFKGKQYTPDGQVSLLLDINTHNRLNEVAELEVWAHKPDRFHGYVCGDDIKTFLGTVLGRIVRRSIHRSNFHGAKVESVTVKGTNGAMYHGRYGADWQYVRLYKSTAKPRSHIKKMEIREAQYTTELGFYTWKSDYNYLGYDKYTGLHKFQVPGGNVELFQRSKSGPAGWHLQRGPWRFEFCRSVPK